MSLELSGAKRALSRAGGRCEGRVLEIGDVIKENPMALNDANDSNACIDFHRVYIHAQKKQTNTHKKQTHTHTTHTHTHTHTHTQVSRALSLAGSEGNEEGVSAVLMHHEFIDERETKESESERPLSLADEQDTSLPLLGERETFP